MRAKVNLGGGEEVKVNRYEVTISQRGNFPIWINELDNKKITEMMIMPFEARYFRQDGWEIFIKQDTYNEQVLIVTRFYRHPEYSVLWDTLQYFTKSGEWKKQPEMYGPLPDDAVRIPLLVLEKVKVKV